MKYLLLLFILVVACSPKGPSSDVLSPEDFKSKIESGATLIDVRTPEEYASGHIAGSVNIDIKDPSFDDKINTLNKTTSYAVYCASGVRSGKAAVIMKEKGFSDVSTLSDGIKSWKEKGLAVE